MYKLIASGSDGNCIIYRDKVMVDIGIKLKDKALIEPYLENIKVIIITHRHSDHLQLPLMKWLIRKHPNIVFMYLQDVREYLDEKLTRRENGESIQIEVPKEIIIEPKKVYNLGFVKYQPINVYHDVPNVCLYFKWKDDFSNFHATDTHNLKGIRIPSSTNLVAIEQHHIEEHYEMVIEEKKASGEYSHEIGARNSHMSFERATEFLETNKLYGATVVRLHLSSHEYYNDMEIEYVYGEKEK